MKRYCAGLGLVWLEDINSKGGSLYLVMTYHSYGALRGFITQKSGLSSCLSSQIDLTTQDM